MKKRTRINRRRFLINSASGLILASFPQIAFASSNPDIVVIGAGAAGLAVGRNVFQARDVAAMVGALHEMLRCGNVAKLADG